MTEYDISGCTVAISTEMENERFLEKCTDKLIADVEGVFDKWYSSKGSCEAVYEDAESVLSLAIDPIVRKGVEILNAQGVYSLDDTSVYKKYLQGCAYEFFDALGEMMDKIEEIEGRQKNEKEYRRQRKAGRGRVVGGGFGLGGALKGMAVAGALNATSGLAHSFANTVGNMGSSIAASTNKAAVYRDFKAVLRKSLVNSACMAQSGIRNALLQEARIRCRYVTVDDSNKAEAIYKNYIAGRIPQEVRKQQIIGALGLNPYKIDTYVAIWTDFGDANGDLRKMSCYFGVDLEGYIAGAAKKYGEELFTKNCGEYEKAFDKKTVAVRIEQKIRATYDALREYCDANKIAESTVPTIQCCSIILQEIDIEQRTFQDIEYETREMAQAVREDYGVLYSFLQEKDIFAEGMFGQVTGLAFHSESFIKHIEDIFEDEKKLRTVDLIHSNIFAALERSLQKDIWDEGWVDIPGFSGNLDNKEGNIRTISNIPQDEVIIACFEGASNGKSGIVLTNLNMRVFSKGVFSNESEVYPIESLGNISCLGNNKYLLEVEKRNSVEIDFSKRKLSVEGQLSFSKALNEAISMIKNLLADDRKQMYRLLNTFMVCECGMHLLVGEKICPKCKRMLKANGELVETEICPKCNNIIPMGKKYCNICGAKLLEESKDIGVQFECGSEDKVGSNEHAVILNGEVKTQEDTEENGMQQEGYHYCITCGNQILFGKKFCSKCGSPVITPNQPENKNTAVVQTMKCHKCNSVIKPGKKFCPACGIKIQ